MISRNTLAKHSFHRFVVLKWNLSKAFLCQLLVIRKLLILLLKEEKMDFKYVKESIIKISAICVSSYEIFSNYRKYSIWNRCVCGQTNKNNIYWKK